MAIKSPSEQNSFRENFIVEWTETELYMNRSICVTAVVIGCEEICQILRNRFKSASNSIVKVKIAAALFRKCQNCVVILDQNH